MKQKILLSKCDACKVPKPGTEFRRDATLQRHGCCIACEDAYEKVQQKFRFPAQLKEAEYHAAYRALDVAKTRRAKGRYPGSQT